LQLIHSTPLISTNLNLSLRIAFLGAAISFGIHSFWEYFAISILLTIISSKDILLVIILTSQNRFGRQKDEKEINAI
jgi:hypothetical protein